MANGGRIIHHLRHNLWRQDCSVIFVGYQAIGTPGRAIVDGARSVKIFGEEIAVRARVYTINGLSAHADQRGIVDWLRTSGDAQVLLVHGEPKGLDTLAGVVREELGRKATVVEPETAYEL
jgi:metallo-beta-lactamase family protein